MEEMAKQLGFESEAEMHRMIADVDISTPEKMSAFKRWQADDGTKQGLLKLRAE